MYTLILGTANIFVIEAIKKLIGLLTKQGKKAIAEKQVIELLVLLKCVLVKINYPIKNPVIIYKKAMHNLLPLVEVKSFKKSGRVIQIPVLIKPAKQIRYALGWLLEVARKVKTSERIWLLVQELLKASKGKGLAIQKKMDLHRKAYKQRAFSRHKV